MERDEIERDLKRLLVTREALGKQLAVVDGDDALASQRTKYQIADLDDEIEGLQGQLASLDQEVLRKALVQLDFTEPFAAFKKVAAKAERRAGAFLIYGATPLHGQRWLRKRLLDHLYREQLQAGGKEPAFHVPPHSFGSGLRRDDPAGLWAEIGNTLSSGMQFRSADDVIKFVEAALRQRDVVLTFERCQELSREDAQRILADLWRPLVQRLEQPPLSPLPPRRRQHRVWLFLLADSPPVEDFGWPVPPPVPDAAQPLRLPPIGSVDEEAVIDWLNNSTLPPDFEDKVNEAVVREVCSRCDQVPGRVLLGLCQGWSQPAQWPASWSVDQWLVLFNHWEKIGA